MLNSKQSLGELANKLLQLTTVGNPARQQVYLPVFALLHLMPAADAADALFVIQFESSGMLYLVVPP